MDTLTTCGNTELFNDCTSQSKSLRPIVKEEPIVKTDKREMESSPRDHSPREEILAVSGGESSKESSPRLEEQVGKKEQAATSAAVIDRKLKKREDRNMEYVLKALSSLTTPEEKLAALCKKYTDLLDENRQHASAVKTSAKRLNQVSRERDSLQTENSKLILAKSKLESLCRELQRHNKVVKEESMARQREEEERRKEVSNRFQTTIGDIQTQMESHSKRNDKLQEDNKELSGKLHTLLEQYEKREEHIQKLLQQKDLETQLLEAKLGQCTLMIEKEQEKGGAEKQMLLEKLIESKTTQETMAQTEVHLKTQLQIYTQKYAEFETTLNKSNEVFAAFKSEMEKMSKKIKKLEKESMTYKQRYENTSKALVEMVEQKTLHEKLIDTQTKKIKQLESLCRALQSRANGEGGASASPPVASTAEDTSSDTATTTKVQNGHVGDDNSSADKGAKTSLDPVNTVRPQAIGQSADDQEVNGENGNSESNSNDPDLPDGEVKDAEDKMAAKIQDMRLSADDTVQSQPTAIEATE